jgi:hypothetical protein
LNKKHKKKRGADDGDRMTLIKNNIPNVRNTKKGMLKHKDTREKE